MASFNKFNSFVDDIAKGVHNLSTGALKVVLTNSAPVATNTILANITQIANGNGYTTGGTATTPTLSNEFEWNGKRSRHRCCVHCQRFDGAIPLCRAL